MVFQRSMLDWRRGGVNLPWVDIHCAIYETVFGVMVFHRSTLDWRRGGGSIWHRICALCYIYLQVELPSLV